MRNEKINKVQEKIKVIEKAVKVIKEEQSADEFWEEYDQHLLTKGTFDELLFAYKHEDRVSDYEIRGELTTKQKWNLRLAEMLVKRQIITISACLLGLLLHANGIIYDEEHMNSNNHMFYDPWVRERFRKILRYTPDQRMTLAQWSDFLCNNYDSDFPRVMSTLGLPGPIIVLTPDEKDDIRLEYERRTVEAYERKNELIAAGAFQSEFVNDNGFTQDGDGNTKLAVKIY